MGFFDTYQDTAPEGSWVGKDEKDTLIANATPMTVVKVERGEGQFGERFVATVTIDGEERLISFPFGTVESRDRMLNALEKYLEDADAEPPVVKLEKAGRAIIISAA